MRYRNREQAGEKLANCLNEEWRGQNPVVIALPRGGVPVAYPIARRLDATLDVLLVRKLGAPGNPEYALGAIAEDGQTWLNRGAMDYLSPGPGEMDEALAQAVHEMSRQRAVFRAGRAPTDVRGRAVIVVDDGLATGSTMLAAIASLRARGALEIAVAVPVASRAARVQVEREVDRIYTGMEPEFFSSVGEWYQNFDPVSDTEVVSLLGAAREVSRDPLIRIEVKMPLGDVRLEGELSRPANCRAWVIFAHGSGSSRKSARNLRAARALNDAGFGTLLFDLLTPDEFMERENVFDIDLLAYRLAKATDWLEKRPESGGRPVGYFGSSTGAAAALQCCARFHPEALAVVSRGGRPDLAREHLERVATPVLLIVGSLDHGVIELNLLAQQFIADARLVRVAGAGHLFEEPGTLDEAIGLGVRFFAKCLDQRLKHDLVA